MKDIATGFIEFGEAFGQRLLAVLKVIKSGKTITENGKESLVREVSEEDREFLNPVIELYAKQLNEKDE
jgi:hypothetical protein